MPILPKKYVRLAKNAGVFVSNYYTPMQFGVAGRYVQSRTLGQYVEEKTPGTGFFMRNTSSHSYKAFVRTVLRNSKASYWQLLTGAQFSFPKEQSRADHALQNATGWKERILEAYSNVLRMAAEAEYLERIIKALKKRVRTGRTSRYDSSLISSYKSRISQLERDVHSFQINVRNECPEDVWQRYAALVDAFVKAAESHRVWHMAMTPEGTAAHQVFFDLGIFNFIQSSTMTPVMRDSQGVRYYLYPHYLLVARSAVDFDELPLKDTGFIYRELAYDDVLKAMTPDEYSLYRYRHHHRHHPAVNDPDGNLLSPLGSYTQDSYGSDKVRVRVVGELYIPHLNLRFCSQDVSSMRVFVQAYNDYRETLD